MTIAQAAQPLQANPETAELPDIQDIIPPEALTNYWFIIVSILGGLVFLGGLIWLMIFKPVFAISNKKNNP